MADQVETVKAKHTPGPWTAVTNELGAFGIEGGPLDAIICQRADWPSRSEESLANARLIAAAPALLAALQAFIPELEQRERFISANDSSWSQSEKDMLDRIWAARTAVKDATGEAE